MQGNLNMIAPDVEVEGKGIILISSEEGETEGNNDKFLKDLGIVDGSILTCDDFLQSYTLKVSKEIHLVASVVLLFTDFRTLVALAEQFWNVRNPHMRMIFIHGNCVFFLLLPNNYGTSQGKYFYFLIYLLSWKVETVGFGLPGQFHIL